MPTYEQLCDQCKSEGIELLERDWKCKGLYGESTIVLSTRIKTTTEKRCVLAEEIGHHETTTADIIDQKKLENVKQELRARGWAYERLIPLTKFVLASEAGCQNKDDLLEYLDVTAGFLESTIKYYQRKHGLYVYVNDYMITLEPLGVIKPLQKG